MTVKTEINLTSKGHGEENSETEPLPFSKRLSAEQLKEALHQFIGIEHWYRHALNRQLLYTDGVQYFAEHGGENGAYWLLDIIATEYGPLLKQEPFMVIAVTVQANTARLEVTDGNDRRLKSREIALTDLQPGIWKFYLTDHVLLLPREY